jgi:hypothetical protein
MDFFGSYSLENVPPLGCIQYHQITWILNLGFVEQRSFADLHASHPTLLLHPLLGQHVNAMRGDVIII